MTTLSVGSFNIGPAKSTDLDMLADLAAVLGFQEGSDQKSTFKAFVSANPGWLLCVGWRSGAAAVPVLVNTTVAGQPVAVTFHKAVGRRWVGPKGAGPTFSKPKWITHVELADGTHVLNTHMIPSATRSRKSLGTKEWEARRKHYRDHIAAIVAVVEACDGPVVLTLDLNAPPDFDLVQPLRDVGFTGWTTEPTMHGEAIDHVLHLKDPAFIETAQMVLNTTSDHKAVVAAFEHTEEPPVPTKPFDKVTFRGRLMDEKTKAFLEAMESELGYELTVVQGCYNPGGVSASSGTHDGGGVVDLAPWDWENKVRVGRKLGGFGWHREAIPGLWGEHIHIGIRDHGRLSPAAQAQQVDYDADPARDGLKGHAVDNTWHPDPPVVFKFGEVKPPPPVANNVTKARDALVEAMHALGTAAALLDNTDPSRVVARKQIEALTFIKAEVKAVLEALPKT